MRSHQELLKEHERQIAEHDSQNQDHQRQIEEWDKTSQHLLSIEHIKGEQGEAGLDGRDGIDGKDADEEAIKASILEVLPDLIPAPIPGKDAEFDQPTFIKAVIREIQNSKALDLTHIKGAQKFIKDGVSYKIEELMHGGGSSTGGTGLKYLPLVSGAINDVNTVFVFASTPTIVVVNGASYINGFGVTISGDTATLDNAPGIGGSVYGLG